MHCPRASASSRRLIRRTRRDSNRERRESIVVPESLSSAMLNFFVDITVCMSPDETNLRK